MRVFGAHFDPMHIDLGQLYWQDYLPLLQQFEAQQFPGCKQLNSLLPSGLVSQGGHKIRFVPSTELDDEAYEFRIYTTGQVSTRANNWHDLFNAFVWMRFPRIKMAMNALHYQAWSQQSDGSRGRLRDALTLFDECGVIVASDHTELLTALSERRWPTAFQHLRSHWGTQLQVAITGHAMLEKYLSPYKSMTAKALLIHTEHKYTDRNALLEFLDRKTAEHLLHETILTKPACLAPLPLAGIPGWWPDATQDEQFYDDVNVFRPPAGNLVPAPIYSLP